LAAEDIDRYLELIEEPRRSTLETVRRRILEVVERKSRGYPCRFPFLSPMVLGSIRGAHLSQPESAAVD